MEGDGAPSPLISTFLAIAAVANGDKSFAMTYLRETRELSLGIRSACSEEIRTLQEESLSRIVLNEDR